ncbi:ChaN family lipoprotein [Thalassospira sp.]|uniref:ChaN family lipoprotein n=1 Tax=Thalassospira sp. TaxID=1912094 RepID=UPI002734573F|nr:ChaN family lipoprotein [Thalassospira sp.]MDP2698223.1 ChaN family lipoprotein [Thalassospira sp.]
MPDFKIKERSLPDLLFATLCIFTVLAVAGQQAAQAQSPLAPPAPGLIYDVASNRYIKIGELHRAVTNVRYVLLGETHDNPLHHHRQAELVDALSQDGLKRTIVWEMFNRDQQADLDAAWVARDPENLGPALDWENSGWPSWYDYQPIASAAAKHNLEISAGNLPRNVLQPMATEGLDALPDDLRDLLNVPDMPGPIADQFKVEIVSSHCGMLPPEKAAPFGLIQYVRDASLARAMFDAASVPGQDGAFLIAGSMHVRSGVAVPFHLERYDPEGSRAVIAMMETGNDGTELRPDDYLARLGGRNAVDFIWFTSAIKRDDPCDAFKTKPAE